jgi:hypothetical protein
MWRLRRKLELGEEVGKTVEATRITISNISPRNSETI